MWSANRLMADTVAALPKTTPFAGFAELVITLQNKLGDPTQLSPAIVLSAPVPAIVSKPNG